MNDWSYCGLFASSGCSTQGARRMKTVILGACGWNTTCQERWMAVLGFIILKWEDDTNILVFYIKICVYYTFKDRGLRRLSWHLIALPGCLERVVVNCLLEPLQSFRCGCVCNVVWEGVPWFWCNDGEGTLTYFQVRIVCVLKGNFQVVVFWYWLDNLP